MTINYGFIQVTRPLHSRSIHLFMIYPSMYIIWDEQKTLHSTAQTILKYADRWYRFTWSGWTPMRRCQSISWSDFGAFFWGTRRHWVGWSPSGLAAWRCGMINRVLISSQVYMYAKSTKLLFNAKSRVSFSCFGLYEIGFKFMFPALYVKGR